MSERLHTSKEKVDDGEVSPEGVEQRERIRETLEQESRRQEKEKDVESLRHEALEKASKKQEKDNYSERKLDKLDKKKVPRQPRGDASFKRTMQHVQSEMGAPSRTFSKLIHLKPIEKTSEVVGATIARPDAILSGAVGGFIFTLTIYLVARHYGYPLSGFESIAGFLVGWAVGLLFDYLKVMVTGKR